METSLDVIRFWKDKEYRNQFAGDQLNKFEGEINRLKSQLAIPLHNPAGMVEELTNDELREAVQMVSICSEYASISTTWCNNPNVC